MPDKDGNLTLAEIEALKTDLENLRALDKSFAKRKAIGQDIAQEVKDRDALIQEIETMIKVYEKDAK